LRIAEVSASSGKSWCDPLVDYTGLKLASRTAKVLGRELERLAYSAKAAAAAHGRRPSAKNLKLSQLRGIVEAWLQAPTYRRASGSGGSGCCRIAAK
jgi:hypothetical protein